MKPQWPNVKPSSLPAVAVAKERLLITASAKNEFTERLDSMTGKTCAVA